MRSALQDWVWGNSSACGNGIEPAALAAFHRRRPGVGSGGPVMAAQIESAAERQARFEAEASARAAELTQGA